MQDLLSRDAWFVYHIRYLYTKNHLKISPTEALQLEKVGEIGAHAGYRERATCSAVNVLKDKGCGEKGTAFPAVRTEVITGDTCRDTKGPRRREGKKSAL